MQITKFGHSCFLVEKGNSRILFDPGTWSEDVSNLKNIDALFLSHEHQDHTDPERIKILLANNSQLKIYTNSGVGKVLDETNIPWTEFTNGQKQTINGLEVEAIGEKHAEIYPSFPIVDNTGFLIGGRLFYPGDSFTVPNKPVEILALPVCAPWLKSAEAIEYAKKINPKMYFPVHDAMLKFPGPFHKLPQMILGQAGIAALTPEVGKLFLV